MGVLGERNDGDEQQPGGGFSLDLEERACPTCRREVAPWQKTCPDDGTATVPVAQLPAADLGIAPPPDD